MKASIGRRAESLELCPEKHACNGQAEGPAKNTEKYPEEQKEPGVRNQKGCLQIMKEKTYIHPYIYIYIYMVELICCIEDCCKYILYGNFGR